MRGAKEKEVSSLGVVGAVMGGGFLEKLGLSGGKVVAPRAAPSPSIPRAIPREGAPSRREYPVVIRWPVASH